MATAAGPVGGLPAKDEITEVEMEIMYTPEEAAERAGLKRAWSSANGSASHGFIGATTAEKKPTLLPHNNVKYLKKAGNGNLLRPDMPDTNALSQSEVKWIEGSIEFCILRLPDIKVVLEPVVILILSSLIKLMRAARTCKWKQTHSSSTFSDFLWPILLNSLAHSAEKDQETHMPLLLCGQTVH